MGTNTDYFTAKKILIALALGIGAFLANSLFKRNLKSLTKRDPAYYYLKDGTKWVNKDESTAKWIRDSKDKSDHGKALAKNTCECFHEVVAKNYTKIELERLNEEALNLDLRKRRLREEIDICKYSKPLPKIEIKPLRQELQLE